MFNNPVIAKSYHITKGLSSVLIGIGQNTGKTITACQEGNKVVAQNFAKSEKLIDDINTALTWAKLKRYVEYAIVTATVVGTLFTLYKKGMIPIIGEVLGNVISSNVTGISSTLSQTTNSVVSHGKEFVPNLSSTILTPQEAMDIDETVLNKIMNSHTNIDADNSECLW